MGIKFGKFGKNVARKCWLMGFCTPENAKNGLLVFWGSHMTYNHHRGCIFHRQLKSFKNPLEW